MVVVHRAFGFRFVMFINDHSPPHVHIFGHGGEAKIILQREGPELDWFVGISRGDSRRIMQEVSRERVRLLEKWREIHEQ